MSATGRPVVSLVLPTGRIQSLETNVRPFTGELVQLGATSYRVRHVCCVYGALDGSEDCFRVTLEAL